MQHKFSVKLSAKDHLRGFLIQARPASKDRKPIGDLRAGEFVQDTTWQEQGIKFQSCDNDDRDSITHDDKKSRKELRFKWKIDNDAGPVQFVYVN